MTKVDRFADFLDRSLDTVDRDRAGFRRMSYAQVLPPRSNRADEHAEIDAQVAEFLARGGAIDRPEPRRSYATVGKYSTAGSTQREWVEAPPQMNTVAMTWPKSHKTKRKRPKKPQTIAELKDVPPDHSDQRHHLAPENELPANLRGLSLQEREGG